MQEFAIGMHVAAQSYSVAEYGWSAERSLYLAAGTWFLSLIRCQAGSIIHFMNCLFSLADNGDGFVDSLDTPPDAAVSVACLIRHLTVSRFSVVYIFSI